MREKGREGPKTLERQSSNKCLGQRGDNGQSRLGLLKQFKRRKEVRYQVKLQPSSSEDMPGVKKATSFP